MMLGFPGILASTLIPTAGFPSLAYDTLPLTLFWANAENAERMANTDAARKFILKCVISSL